ncbi:hypothetical protein [Bacillus sp. EAC]|uniref:hypothetical protein n=1 Tax=Bacillus sp. EAC TaxID=1978338 RepID=UPI000B4354D3|nr:hypothetical protein [Bacillus sp. EAC]
MRVTKLRQLYLTILLILTFSLIGCSDNQVTHAKCGEKKDVHAKCVGNFLLEGKTVNSVTISRVGESALDLKEPHATYHKDASIELQTFIDAIKKANKIDGIVDVAKAGYYLTISFENKTSSHYFLWLSDDGGSIMNENDSNTMYTIHSDLISDLNKYVNGNKE